MKIAVITCYHDPDYIRARTLRAGLKLIPGAKVVVVKNKHKGVLRYPEIFWKIWQTRRHEKPDAYLLTFRGQEILPIVLLLKGKKPLFFDEFIVPIAYAKYEKHKRSMAITTKHTVARLSEPLYRMWLHRCKVILADTPAHAELSARTSHMNLRKYLAVPVGTDEKVFKPGTANLTSDKFQVFYYTTGMQPLHGIGTVLAAAEELQDNPDIEFLVVGGKKPMEQAVSESQKRGAHVVYKAWIPFDELPATMQNSGLCLGGPFGDTMQANHVITGKTYQMLACGAPVMVGASDATNEYFIDKKNALVVVQGDAPALAKALTWAYKNQDELKSIAANGRKLYEKSFSTAAIAQKLQRLVDEAS